MIDEFGHPVVGPSPTVTPPQTDSLVWVREDRITAALSRALQIAIRNHLKILGNDVKSVAWDVREEFEKAMKS